jgi:hypothetical protein
VIFVLTALLSFVASILGSLVALAIWFHYDLEGFWEHKRHDRIIREGAKREARARKAFDDHEATLRDFHNDGYES